MKIVYLKTNHIGNIFNQLQQDLGGKLKIRPNEYNLVLDNDIANGKIRGVSFDHHIAFLEFDLTFKEDALLINNVPVTNPIHFMYCAKGEIMHSFGIIGEKRPLNQFQTGIFSSDPSQDTTLFFGKDQPVKLFHFRN